MAEDKMQTLANSLYVSHFPIPMNEDRLMKLFKPHGEVREIVLKYSSIHSDWGPSHAFIHFEPVKSGDDSTEKSADSEENELNPAVIASIAALNGEGGNEAIQRMLDEEGKTDERWRSEKLEVKTRTIGGSRGQMRRKQPLDNVAAVDDDKSRPSRVFEAPERGRLRRPPPPVVDASMRDTRDDRDYRRDRSPPRRPMRSRSRSPIRDRDRYAPPPRDYRHGYDRYDDRYDDRYGPDRRRDWSPPRHSRGRSPSPPRREMAPPGRSMRRPSAAAAGRDERDFQPRR